MRILASMTAGTAALLIAAWHLSGGANASAPDPASLAADAGPSRALAFEPNLGQAAPHVRFVSRGNGFVLLLTDTGAVLRRAGGDVRITIAGAQRPEVAGTGRLPGASHYFTGNDAGRWQRAVPRYARATFSGVRDGVDLAWHGHEGQVELGFTIAPGAAPDAIAFDIAGATGPALEASGDLLLQAGADTVALRRPRAWQVAGGMLRPVDVGYRMLDADTVGIEPGTYDPALPLVVVPMLVHQPGEVPAPWPGPVLAVESDPGVAVWAIGLVMSVAGGGTDAYACRLGATSAAPDCAYFGGAGDDAALALATGPDGGVHVAGYTDSRDFPVVAAHQDHLAGARDGFVVRIDASFDGPRFSTYLGGGGVDVARAVAVDASGTAYVTGETSSRAFPVTAGAVQVADPAGPDAFVAKLEGDGTLTFATYLGGSRADGGRRIAIDDDGHLYVSGHTASADFPARLPVHDGVADTPADVHGRFLAKVHRDGGRLVDGTYLVATDEPRPD